MSTVSVIFKNKRSVVFLLFILFICVMVHGQNTSFSTLFKLEKRIQLMETDETLISDIQDMDVDSRGDIWIIDWSTAHLIKYDSTSGHPRIIARKGKGPAELHMPESLYINSNDRVYVANTIKRVTIFDINGKYIDSFIPTDGHMPTTCVNSNSQGSIVLGGPKSRRDEKTGAISGNMIHVYSPKGSYINSFCRKSDKLKQLNLTLYRSAYFSLDDRDNIYVVQPLEHQVSVFDTNGNLKRTFGQKQDYYKEPTYCSEAVRNDKKKWNEFMKTFTYVLDIFIFEGKVFVLSRNYIDRGNTRFRYFIDIYKLDGTVISSGIEVPTQLYRIKNGKFYFAYTIPLKEENEQKIIEIYRMK